MGKQERVAMILITANLVNCILTSLISVSGSVAVFFPKYTGFTWKSNHECPNHTALSQSIIYSSFNIAFEHNYAI